MSAVPHSAPSEVSSADLALIADWLALQFLNPPDAARLEAARSIEGQAALQQIGAILCQPDATAALCRHLSVGPVAEAVIALQRRHTALFEGIFRQRGLPPYASVWDGTGRLFGPAVGRMQRLLRGLDIHVAEGCCEPPDHIAIQLAALAEALRQDRSDIVPALLDELNWIDRFAASLTEADRNGFYGAVALLLTAFAKRTRQARSGVAGSDRPSAAASI
ncbi:MAG: molecular chaperone TorD family protein [Rhodobacteraceae bacterium]|nr:molecular chaperone TorD family protein [Paracoccaceae bacterium]